MTFFGLVGAMRHDEWFIEKESSGLTNIEAVFISLGALLFRINATAAPTAHKSRTQERTTRGQQTKPGKCIK